jgi:hypothetical protein
MALTLDQARKRLSHVRAKTGSKDLDDILRGLIDQDFAAEMLRADMRLRSRFFEDFLAAELRAGLSSTAGSGTGNAAATTVAGAMNGEVTLKSASDNGTHAANNSLITLDQLNYKANQGGLVFEARLKTDSIANCYIFVGFTDTISTTVESPLFMTAADVDSDATDACGLIFDTAATTDQWTLAGVKNNTDTSPSISGNAPVAATYQALRVEVDAAGTVYGYIDGAKVGEVANAVTITVGLTPCIAVGNNAAEQKTLTIDYVDAWQNR